MQRTLVFYAFGTWIYRTLLFIGIALLVYSYTFKLAGIILASVEVAWFILRPIQIEIRNWWRLRSQMHWNLTIFRTILGSGAFLFLLLVPWHSTIDAPAIIKAQQHLWLYPPVASRVTKILVQENQSVNIGDPLILLNAPDLEFSLKNITTKIHALQWSLQHTGSGISGLKNEPVLQKELSSALAEKDILKHRLSQLTITAPFAGIIKELPSGLVKGLWIARDTPMVELLQNNSTEIEAYVDETNISRIIPDSLVTFYPLNLDQPSIQVRVIEVAPTALRWLAHPMMASLYGGPIAARKDNAGRLITNQALYPVKLKPLQAG